MLTLHAYSASPVLNEFKSGAEEEPSASETISSVAQVPHGAAGLFQLGRIARLLDRPAEASGYYAEALALDPLLWVAYEELCSLGESLLSVAAPRASPWLVIAECQ